MRMIFISLAAAASALAVASPAAAQWAPQHYGQPGYGYNPGYGYGYQDQRSRIRDLQARVHQVRDRIRRLDRTNRLGHREARRLDHHAAELERRIHFAASRGLHQYERRDIQLRVEALRQAVRYAVRENRRWGWNGQNRYDNGFGYYGARVRDDDRRFEGRERRRDRDDDRYERDDD